MGRTVPIIIFGRAVLVRHVVQFCFRSSSACAPYRAHHNCRPRCACAPCRADYDCRTCRAGRRIVLAISLGRAVHVRRAVPTIIVGRAVSVRRAVSIEL